MLQKVGRRPLLQSFEIFTCRLFTERWYGSRRTEKTPKMHCRVMRKVQERDSRSISDLIYFAGRGATLYDFAKTHPGIQ
jgi:hypothetical protein